MSSRLPLTLFVVFLAFFIGGSIFVYKLMNGFPLSPEDKVNSWHIELGLKLENASENTELRVALPDEGHDLKVIDSHITDNGFGDYVGSDNDGSYLLWSKRNPEKTENLYYRAIIYKVKSADTTPSEYVPQSLLPRSQKLTDEASVLILENIRKKLRAESASEFSFITGLQRMIRENKDPDLQSLHSKMGKADMVTIATEILNFSDIPARSMNGILLSSAKRDAEIMRWVDVYTLSRKISFSPTRDNIGMPPNILSWWSGDNGLVTMKDSGATIAKEISVKRHTESALTEAIWGSDKIKSTLYSLTIYALPVELQVVMRILLLIPLGALACIIVKQVVGIKTFGTFMPVLLAMAFRETSLLSGILLFSILIGVGIIFRGIFDKMRLLTVPRLGAVLTVTVLCVFFLALSLDGLGFEASGLSLFPLVILTMMIERISVTWDEAGAKHTATVTLSTLFVASICYLVIVLPAIEHIFTTFPELLLIIMGLMLLVGRYNGYKLTEYYRFKALKI
jgi:hypothetical protein